MKNLKKVLALVLTCAMIFGVVSVATAAGTNYPDVAANATYAEAVHGLSALGIIQGDEQGNFNPDQPVTRAEISKILYAMVSTGTASQTDSGFNDVKADHWASGYIAGAKQLGYIDGYDATTFGPEDSVTYEQAIKLILCAMGYKPAATTSGGFPTGYLMVAADIGLTKGITNITGKDNAPRNIIAMLVYNGMNLPIMKQTEYGDNPKYTAMDGSEAANKVFTTLLNKTYDTYKVEGLVMANSKTGLGLSAEDDPGYVSYVVTNSLKVNPSDLGFNGYDYPSTLNPFVMTSVKAEGTGAEDLLGYWSVAYLKSLDDSSTDWEILSITSKQNRNIETNIASADQIFDPSKDSAVRDADQFNLSNLNNKLVYSYWNDRDKDSKITVKEVDPSAFVIWNGVVVGSIDDLTANQLSPDNAASVVVPSIGSVKLVDVDNDGKIDIINCKSYAVGIVTNVNTSSEKISIGTHTSGLGSSINLNQEDNADLKEVTITKDGASIQLSDLQENDVLNVCTDDIDNPTFFEIIVTRSSVEGTVTETDIANNEYAIGDKTYGVTKGMDLGLDVNTEGIFYLDMDGNILTMDASRSNANFAYLVKMGGTDFEDVQMKMFTADGTKVINVSDKVKINGVSKTKVTTQYTKGDINNIFENSNNYTAFPTTNVGDLVKLSDVCASYGDYKADGSDAFTPAILLQALTGQSYNNTDAPVLNANLTNALTGNAQANAFVAYDTDSNDLIKVIDLAINNPTTESDFNFMQDKFTSSDSSYDGVEWKASFNKFNGSKAVSDAAKVFMVSGSSVDDYKVIKVSDLNDGSYYKPMLFGNVDGEATAILLLSDTSIFDANSSLAVFDSSSRGTYDGDEVTLVKAYNGNGKLQNALMVESADVSGCGYNDVSDLKLGDTFIYTVDSKGYVDKIHVVFSPGADKPAFDGTADFNSYLDVNGLTDWGIYDSNDDTKSQVYYGYLADFPKSSASNRSMNVLPGSGDYNDAQQFLVPLSVPVIEVNTAYAETASRRVKAGLTIQDVDPSDYSYSSKSDRSIIFDPKQSNVDDMRYVFVRTIDQEPTDIIYVNYSK